MALTVAYAWAKDAGSIPVPSRPIQLLNGVLNEEHRNIHRTRSNHLSFRLRPVASRFESDSKYIGLTLDQYYRD